MKTPLEIVKQARDKVNECDNQALCEAIDKRLLVIDVREGDEYQEGYIAHSVNIPRGLIEFAIFDHPATKPMLDKDDMAHTPIYLYCKTGGRSALAAESLQRLGFKAVYSLAGGIAGWEADGYKMSSSLNYEY